jgi:hypothetical protein
MPMASHGEFRSASACFDCKLSRPQQRHHLPAHQVRYWIGIYCHRPCARPMPAPACAAAIRPPRSTGTRYTRLCEACPIDWEQMKSGLKGRGAGTTYRPERRHLDSGHWPSCRGDSCHAWRPQGPLAMTRFPGDWHRPCLIGGGGCLASVGCGEVSEIWWIRQDR